MKKMEKRVLPVVAGLLFTLHAFWMFWFYLSMLEYSFFLIPIYLFVAVMLFRRHRDQLLVIAVGALMLARLWSFNLARGADTLPPAQVMLSTAYLTATVLLLAAALFNSVYALKRFRHIPNRLWFLPGTIMLAAFVWCCISTRAYQQPNYFTLRTWILSMSNQLCCPLTDALATLAVSRWVAVSAEDDLQPYLSIRGNIITEEEFQAKKRELGLKQVRT